MPTTSSYLKYLPPILWDSEMAATQLPLGQMLCIFEKMLTGIDDGVAIPTDTVPDAAGPPTAPTRNLKRGTHYAALQDIIATSHRLYQPWSVSAASPNAAARAGGDLLSTDLDWLAQWVALRLHPTWNDYQRRKATAEIVQVYARRGSKEGLNKLLELYAISSLRPRVVIDDASKVLFSRPVPGQIAPIYTLVSQLPLIAPHCLALAPDGRLYVGDVGNVTIEPPEFEVTPQPPGVWPVTTSGHYDYVSDSSDPPAIRARPIGPPSDFTWNAPTAIAVDRSEPHFGVYVLCSTNELFRLASDNFYPSATDFRVFATPDQLAHPQSPIGMIVNQDGDLLILDQRFDTGECRILQIRMQGNPAVFEETTVHPLAGILEPKSFAQLPDGTLVVGDAGDQTQATPAALWKVDPANDWQTTLLLGADQSDNRDRPDRNPLVAPVAIVVEDATHLLVLDVGLKPFAPSVSHFRPLIGRQAAIYRVDMAAQPVTVTRATELQQMVFPRGMVRDRNGTLYICDSGLQDIQHGYQARVWRSLPQAFTVVVHFPLNPDANDRDDQEQARFLQSIRDVVENEHPAQSFWAVQPTTE